MKYVPREDITEGFNDKQLDRLMENITVFMPMDGCNAPCGICALSANKSPKYSMDFEAVEWFYKNYPDPFNKNQPNEYAMDLLGFIGRDGETYHDVLELHKEHHTYYPTFRTALPVGSEKTLLKILEMEFVNEHHGSENLSDQLVVPTISRVLHNAERVDAYLASLSERELIERIDEGTAFLGTNNPTYIIRTDHGLRDLNVIYQEPVFVGSAAGLIKDPSEVEGNQVYLTCTDQGVALLPTGFYVVNPMFPFFDEFLKNKITPDNFIFKPRREVITGISFRKSDGAQIISSIDKNTDEVVGEPRIIPRT